jgi:tRNA-dihydrouridine synthase B
MLQNKTNSSKSASTPWFENRPLVALAPMEAVTDSIFRKIVRSIAPEVILYTEFAPARGLLHDAEPVWKMAEFDESERPLIVQLYDNDAPSLGLAAERIVKHHRPDGIDLNMGCPVKKVARRGAGCGMMADVKNAAESIRQIIEYADGVPVSLKTRLGISDKKMVLDLAGACIDAGVQQITIHARLKADRPRIPADWKAMSFAAKKISVPVMGNGDIWTAEDAKTMSELEGIDGVMIGRGAIGNPWLLQRSYQALAGLPVDQLPNKAERARVAIMHLKENVKYKGERRGVLELRKIVRNYIKGYLDSKRTWMKIIEVETEKATANILEEFGKSETEIM